MDFVNILSPGKKINNIRTSLGLKQSEITGGQITRNLISMIENDKVALTAQVAEIIANNINKVCETKGTEFRVSASYLLEDEKMQASRIADRYIKFLDDNLNNISLDLSKEISNIEKFLVYHDINEKKAVIYEKIGDMFKIRSEYYSSYTYYLKAFENGDRLFNDIKLPKLLLKIGHCCIKLKRYKEAIDFNRLAFIYNDKMPSQLRYDILFNNIFAYKKLGLHDKALSEIEYIEEHFREISSSESFELLTLKANCLKESKYYKDSLELHKQLLQILEPEDLVRQLVVICNILEIYVFLSDIKNIRKYIDRSINYINSIDNLLRDYYAPQIYSEIAKACVFINEVDIAKEYFKNSIMAAKHLKQHDLLLTSLEFLFNIYEGENDIKELDNIKNELLEFILAEPHSNYTRLVYKLIDYYNSIHDGESIKGLLNFVLNIDSK